MICFQSLSDIYLLIPPLFLLKIIPYTVCIWITYRTAYEFVRWPQKKSMHHISFSYRISLLLAIPIKACPLQYFFSVNISHQHLKTPCLTSLHSHSCYFFLTFQDFRIKQAPVRRMDQPCQLAKKKKKKSGVTSISCPAYQCRQASAVGCLQVWQQQQGMNHPLRFLFYHIHVLWNHRDSVQLCQSCLKDHNSSCLLFLKGMMAGKTSVYVPNLMNMWATSQARCS